MYKCIADRLLAILIQYPSYISTSRFGGLLSDLDNDPASVNGDWCSVSFCTRALTTVFNQHDVFNTAQDVASCSAGFAVFKM